jgi:hypothetical protein
MSTISKKLAVKIPEREGADNPGVSEGDAWFVPFERLLSQNIVRRTW